MLSHVHSRAPARSTCAHNGRRKSDRVQRAAAPRARATPARPRQRASDVRPAQRQKPRKRTRIVRNACSAAHPSNPTPLGRTQLRFGQEAMCGELGAGLAEPGPVGARCSSTTSAPTPEPEPPPREEGSRIRTRSARLRADARAVAEPPDRPPRRNAQTQGTHPSARTAGEACLCILLSAARGESDCPGGTQVRPRVDAHTRAHKSGLRRRLRHGSKENGAARATEPLAAFARSDVPRSGRNKVRPSLRF